MHVVGLDLSLTATGVASIAQDDSDSGAPWVMPTVETFVFGTGTAGDAIRSRSLRLRGLADRICQQVRTADLAVIERPAFGASGATSGAITDRAGLWWLVVARLDAAFGIPVVEVSSNTLKMYALGIGKGSKDQVLSTVVRRYGHLAPELADNNEADALILADMGARYFGQALVDLPLTHLRAMKSPKWAEAMGAK